MKKNIKIILFLLLADTLPAFIYSLPQSPWILGSLHYEGSFGAFPTPLYYEGNNIIPSANKQKTRLDFEIPRSRNNQTYYILITECVIAEAKKMPNGEQIINTFDYLKVPRNNNYKLYQISLQSELFTNPQGKIEKIHYWETTEMILPENGQIPSQTVIIYDLPERVLSFDSGGSLLSWPAIYMHTPSKHDQSFIDRMTKMHLSVVDLNTIHVPIKKAIEHVDNNKKIIIAFSS